MSVFDISVIVLVVLGTVLAFVTYRLLSEDKRRNANDVRKINAVYVFIIFFMVICQIVILDRFTVKSKTTLTNRDGFSVSVAGTIPEVTEGDVPATDTLSMMFDREDLFCFEVTQRLKPAIRKIRGFDAYLKTVGFETQQRNAETFLNISPGRRIISCLFADASLRPYDEILHCIRDSPGMERYGDLLRRSSSTQVAYGSPVQVIIGSDSETPLDELLEAETAATQEENERGADSTGATGTRKPQVMIFRNYFNITVFRKDTAGDGDEFTLANYFVTSTANLVYTVEKIVADEKNILMASNLELKNVEYFNTRDRFTVHRWLRMAECDDRIILAELAYSPQTDSKSAIWQEMKASFESLSRFR